MLHEIILTADNTINVSEMTDAEFDALFAKHAMPSFYGAGERAAAAQPHIEPPAEPAYMDDSWGDYDDERCLI